jgi:hypothetical protein
LAPLAALSTALLIVFGLVVPVLAVNDPTSNDPNRLFDPSVSPRTGLPTTKIHFAVSYRNPSGGPADHVVVVVDQTLHEMAGDGGSNWKLGVRYTWSGTLPVGTHAISFEASDSQQSGDTIDAGTVTITKAPAPGPTPTPPPRPAPEPTPTATPRPTQKPAPDPTPTPAAPTGNGPASTPAAPPYGDGSSTGTGTIGSPPGGLGTDSGGLSGPTGAGGSGGDTAGLGLGGSTDGTGAVLDTTLGGGPSGGTGLASGPGWGGLASAFQVLGLGKPRITLVPMLVGTTGAMTMAFAFAIFGKKRRDGQPPAPDEVLKASAARGHDEVPRGDVAAGIVRSPAVAAPADLEAGVPRWRRASLIEARKADPSRYVATTPNMSFENGAAGAEDGRERRVIRYRVVRLLDAPDELRSVEICQLDQGDEVQLLERSGSYWLVHCPDGRQGWLHKMTLGEIDADGASAHPWDSDVDSDVLGAFLRARARA